MQFDIKTFIASLWAMVQLQFADDWVNIKDTALDFSDDKKIRLTALAVDLEKGPENGGIDEAFFAERLKDEISILKSEGAALALLGQVKAEQIVNSIVDFGLKTILTFIQLNKA